MPPATSKKLAPHSSFHKGLRTGARGPPALPTVLPLDVHGELRAKRLGEIIRLDGWNHRLHIETLNMKVSLVMMNLMFAARCHEICRLVGAIC